MPEKDIANYVRLKPFFNMFGEVKMVASIRINGVLNREPGVPMIPVIETIEPERVVRKNHVWPIRPNRLDDIAEKFAVRLQHPVRIRQHDEIGDSDHISRCFLFPTTNFYDLFRSHRFVIATATPGSADEIRDFTSVSRPNRSRPTRADLRIIRMGADHHRAFRYFVEML